MRMYNLVVKGRKWKLSKNKQVVIYHFERKTYTPCIYLCAHPSFKGEQTQMVEAPYVFILIMIFYAVS